MKKIIFIIGIVCLVGFASLIGSCSIFAKSTDATITVKPL